MEATTNLNSTALQVIDHFLGFQSRHASGIAGFQAAIRDRGELIFSKGYGSAHLESGTPYRTSHLGHIASHSKTMAATLLLMLEEDGLLRLDDLLVKHLPQFASHKDRRFRQITLEHLASNRSGIFRDGLDCSFWEMEKKFPTYAQIEKEIMAAPLVYAPGVTTKYSNIGFSLLGFVIEAAGGKPYEALLQERILDRLESRDALPEYDLALRDRFADGHSTPIYDRKMRIFPHTATGGMIAATGLCANAEAISEFLYKLYFTDVFLKPASRRKMLNRKWPVMNLKGNQYGLGAILATEKKSIYIGHSGGFPGFVSITRWLKNSDYIFSLIFNSMEPPTMATIQSMAGIIESVKETFKEKDAQDLTITDPMMTKWGAILFVVGKRKALMLPLDGWRAGEDKAVLDLRKDGFFYTDSISGYDFPGEKVEFLRRGRSVSKVRFGAFTYYPEKDFLKRSARVFQRPVQAN